MELLYVDYLVFAFAATILPMGLTHLLVVVPVVFLAVQGTIVRLPTPRALADSLCVATHHTRGLPRLNLRLAQLIQNLVDIM